MNFCQLSTHTALYANQRYPERRNVLLSLLSMAKEEMGRIKNRLSIHERMDLETQLCDKYDEIIEKIVDPNCFTVLQEARYGRDKGITFIALVDRKLSQRHRWTSDDPTIIRSMNQGLANHVCSKLRRNCPQVVSFASAAEQCLDQKRFIGAETTPEEQTELHS